MPRIITYSLRNADRNSDAYYHAIADFSQRWVETARASVAEEMAGFQAYRQALDQPARSFPECAFELLALGVMLREHGLQAGHMPSWMVSLLKKLMLLQGRYPWSEKAIKTLRGWVVHLAGPIQAGRSQPGQTRLVEIQRLLEWMQALDYGGQVERLSEWQSYFETLDPERVGEAIAGCLRLADDFEQDSARALGAYTRGVAAFLQAEAPRHAWQYDARFVSRRPLEYHLGLLGSELLSRAYRERFLETQRKVVILPPCMRRQPEEACKAISTPLGDRCQNCTPGCPIQVVTKLGEKLGFEVFMMPDELRKFKSGSPQGKNTFGVIGVLLRSDQLERRVGPGQRGHPWPGAAARFRRLQLPLG